VYLLNDSSDDIDSESDMLQDDDNSDWNEHELAQ
jgi:hypothetical protein